jgi:hypothetical protein
MAIAKEEKIMMFGKLFKRKSKVVETEPQLVVDTDPQRKIGYLDKMFDDINPSKAMNKPVELPRMMRTGETENAKEDGTTVRDHYYRGF